jgi:peptide/nickel transport system substrate-binding protein
MNTRVLCAVVALCATLGLSVRYAGEAVAESPGVTVAQTQDMETGDPQKTAVSHTYNVLSNIYDTLISRDAQYQLKPGLAVSWRQVEPATWEFKLRRGVKFHDGEPFDARAVKFSVDRALDPKTKWVGAGSFRPVKSVIVVDDYTVRIITDRPWPLLPRYMPFFGPWIVPPQYIEKYGEDAFARRPVGTGPYRLVSWARDDRVELAANPSYWAGPPRISRVIFRTIPSEPSRLAELLAGSVDLINLVSPEVYDAIRRSPRNKLVASPSAGIYFVPFNLVNIPRERPLADKRVRQAINFAIDRKAIINGVMHGGVFPLATFCIGFSLGCDTSIAPFSYDPQKARSLLREAGYANGVDFTISTTDGGYPEDRNISLAVADQLNKVGIRTRVMVDEYSGQIRSVIDRKLKEDSWFTRFTDYTGAAGGIAFRAFHPRGGYSLWIPGNPEIIDLMEKAELAVDEATIKDVLHRLQLAFKDEAPLIPLFTSPNVYGMKQELDFAPRPDYLLTMFDASWRR